MTPAIEPDDGVLRKFLLGTLPPDQAARVEQWMERNPDAVLRLREFDARDTVIDAIGRGTPPNTSSAAHRLETTVRYPVPTRDAAGIPGTVGSYVVVRELGRGGMGVVLEAEDRCLNRRVAIKLIAAQFASHPEARERFLREARAVARIDHPNVVPVHHVGEHNGQLYLVMPLLRGEALDVRLKREKRLRAAEVLRIGREVAAGLAAAHAVGLIHRDIKPANIWLDADGGRARVLDFGLAKPLDQAGDELTGTGAVLGTLHYMSPQQANGEPLDTRTDLFSLGAVLHHAATGQRPFDGPTRFAILYSVVNDPPQNPEALAAALPARAAETVRALLEKRPEARPSSATEVIERLGDAPTVVAIAPPAPAPAPWDTAGGPTEVDEPETARPRPDARPPRRTWVAVAASLLLALGAAAAVYQVEFATKEGTLVVEVNDAAADVRFKNGELHLYGTDGKLKYTLKPGERNAKLPTGRYAVRVEGADGVALDTAEFTMKKDGQVTIRVTARQAIIPPPPAKDTSPDRKAAEWVLSVGGSVRVNGEPREITAAADLPRGRFDLTDATVEYKRNVSNASLAVFQGCKSIRRLNLKESGVTDEGLKHLKDCTGLQELHLSENAITGAGLVHLAGCLDLQELGLVNTRVTNEELRHLKGLTGLQKIGLRGTDVTDAGLQHLRACEKLRTLYLDRTEVSEKGARALAEALPKCKIEWDGGTIEPRK
jgi:serine/threonine protein kinase